MSDTAVQHNLMHFLDYREPKTGSSYHQKAR